MIKPTILGLSLKEILTARAHDRLYRFGLQDNTVRGALVNAPHLIREMRASHQLGIMETLILGQSYLAALLTASSLKGEERIHLQIDCSGPLKGLSVEATHHGEVRGYLYTPSLEINTPLTHLDFSPFIQEGTLTIRRFLPQAKAPYSGRIALVYANLAADLALYFRDSEQTPSAFNLSVRFTPEGEIEGGAGLMIQAMPGADPEILDTLSQRIQSLPSLGKSLDKNQINAFITDSFGDFHPTLLADTRVEFFCHCNPAILHNMVRSLPPEELNAMLAEDRFPVESHCRNCNSPYAIEKEEVERIYAQKLN